MSIIVTTPEDLRKIIAEEVAWSVAAALKVESKELINRNQAAELLGIHTTTLSKKVLKYNIRNYNPGGHPRYLKSDILNLK